jgi:disulfide bond formation protein DsbB
VLRRAVVDPGYSVDVGDFVGAAFVDGRRLAVLGHNKSYVLLEENDAVDARQSFRFFREPSLGLDELARGRFATVRARLSYVMSFAYDAASDSFYSATVPSHRYPALVVSRFSRADMTLSEEYRPRLASGSGLALAGEERSLDELYVTGLAVADGRMYALSAAYGTLLVLDPASREVVGARAIPGLVRPSGLAVRGQELWIAGADGRVTVVDRP